LIFLLVDAATAVVVSVRSPSAGEPAFGEVPVEVEVISSEPIVSVEIVVDGELVESLTEPPYRTVVDVGNENRSHIFEVTATDATGASDTWTVVTGAIAIDERVELELQQLYVTVTRGGERVLDLAGEQFEVLDNGIPQKVVTFERGDVPLTAALLVDSSLSMEGDALRAALAGARAFVEGMGELDEAKVMAFSDRLLATTPFTGDPGVVSEVVDRIEPGGSTAINDHLFLSLKELEARQGRKVIILLSDGLDVDSVLDMADVDWKAGRVQSVVYWIRPVWGADLERQHSSVWRDSIEQRREVDALAQTVETSGGRTIDLERIEDAETAFREILQELREQYVIGYYPSRDLDDGAWHRVEVRAASPGAKVRVRGGYYDDAL
jgi:Ca-activated chloride channel family protein